MKKVIVQNSINTVELKDINENFVYVRINEVRQLIGISYRKNNQFYWLDFNKTNLDQNQLCLQQYFTLIRLIEMTIRNIDGYEVFEFTNSFEALKFVTEKLDSFVPF